MTVFAFQSEKDFKKLYQLLLLLLKQYIFVRFKSLIDSTLKKECLIKRSFIKSHKYCNYTWKNVKMAEKRLRFLCPFSICRKYMYIVDQVIHMALESSG